jgi:uncharacterized membrane protein SpoIIM required for sporulation
LREEEERHLARLKALVERAAERGPAALAGEELAELPRLYRFASSLYARVETLHGGAGGGDEERTLERLRPTLLAAHGLLHRPAERGVRERARALGYFLLTTSPRALRGEWRLIVTSLVIVYGLAALAYALVRQDLALAYTFMDPGQVEAQLAQLRAVEEGEAFRGNFTFGLEKSPGTAGWIIGNNLRAAVLFFASALLPPLYILVLAMNSFMLGTYTAVAGHWDQAASISSILWCHGVLEIQALVLAGTAGLVVLRGWIRPGARTRTCALRHEGRRALELLAPVLPMLLVAGLIEGFVSPHAPDALRWIVAGVSGAALLFWVLAAGRAAR